MVVGIGVGDLYSVKMVCHMRSNATEEGCMSDQNSQDNEKNLLPLHFFFSRVFSVQIL